MRITLKEFPEDPEYPMMHGKTPLSREFNKRQNQLWVEGRFRDFPFEQTFTVISEILVDDYNKRHATKKKAKK